MSVDTKSMRELVDAAPGSRLAMTKMDIHALIDATPGDHVPMEKGQLQLIFGAIDLGRVADQLVATAGELRAMAIAA